MRITVRRVTFAGPLVALLAIYMTSSTLCPILRSSTSPRCFTDTAHQNHSGYKYKSKPHHSSWSAWWHPQRRDDLTSENNWGAGAITKDWNIIYHLGGNGPWIEKIVDVVEGGIGPPPGCQVEQVHMMSRHAERYPTKRAGYFQQNVVERMKKSGKTFNESLAFFNDWELFWSDDSSLDQLTTTGPFCGTLGAFTTGVRLRTRYQHLLVPTNTSHPKSPITFWASGSNRVIQTAKHFALGFFGIDNDIANTTRLQIIPEHSSLGANTLTPGRTCLANKRDVQEGRAKGYRRHKKYRAIYQAPIRDRLLKQTGMAFNDQEIYAMQEICGFEMTVRGRSSWCDVFTRDEFLAFEYSRDLMHYYRSGPGQRYAGSMGWLWLNATTNLLLEGLSAGSLFFSFVHDGDIVPMITALDIMNEPVHLPTTHILPARKWRKSQVTPMGGRVIFELLSCEADHGASSNYSFSSNPITDKPFISNIFTHNTSTPDASPREKFVRLNINDGITAIPDCNSGPGHSCPLAQFAARTKRRGEEVGDFRDLCGLDPGAPERILFLHQ